MNKFVIVVTQYNTAPYIKKCLDSIVSQEYKNYEVVVVDDCSDDGTWDIVTQYPFHKIRNNVNNHLAFTNILQGIRYLPLEREAIIVLLSGDDYFADNQVLSHLDEVYKENVWLTYGQFVPLSGKYGPYCTQIPSTATYRKLTGYHEGWLASHLLTFKIWLFDLIKDEDLRYEGEYSRYACDTAFLYPMIEMAGNEHIRFIERVLYIYNDLNPMCISKINRDESIKESQYFKNKPSYNKIDG